MDTTEGYSNVSVEITLYADGVAMEETAYGEDSSIYLDYTEI